VNVLQAVILTNKEKIILTPTYHVMEMYNVHQGASMIPVTLNNLFYTEGKDSLPAISVSASRDSQGVIHITLVNIDPAKPNMVQLKWPGAQLKLDNGRILHSSKIQDHNSFEQPDKIIPQAFRGASMKGQELSVDLPPASVVVLTLHG
jgi:alpha-L-arabinofuranosidase